MPNSFRHLDYLLSIQILKRVQDDVALRLPPHSVLPSPSVMPNSVRHLDNLLSIQILKRVQDDTAPVVMPNSVRHLDYLS